MSARGVASLSLTNGGNGYQVAPAVTFSNTPGFGGYNTADGGATATTSLNTPTLEYKGIIEGFDPQYGTLNVELGDSIPVLQAGQSPSQAYLLAAIMPFGYVDPTSELVAPNTTAAWRVDHIGVDAHALHVHLFNAQILGYLDIAGQLYMPDSNQYGWNETIRTEPFTNAYIALKPKMMYLPWEIPNSIRYLDPSQPPGAVNGPAACINNPFALQPLLGPTCVPFQQVDPTANAVTITNALLNFGYEYVYHCHLLSHEEHDMMRPISFAVAPRNDPSLTRTQTVGATRTITITDNSVNETEFVVQQQTGGLNGAWTTVLDAAGLPVAVQSPNGSGTGRSLQITGIPPSSPGVRYRVVAGNAVGCNANVPVPNPGGVQNQQGFVCSNPSTGWPIVELFSPGNTVLP
jgi:hypothetical protein